MRPPMRPPMRLLCVCLGLAPALGAIGTVRAAERQATAERPNVLFVFTDDQRWDTIHALGNPEITTPNLDRSENFMPRHPFENGDLLIRDEMLAPFPRTPEVMRRHLADYYAVCTYIDAQVGRLLGALERRGLADETVVIFSSDQGLAVGGRHGLMGKQNLYEHVKPPLVFAGPGIRHGQSDALVYLFDLFPTICDLARAETPDAVRAGA